MSMRALSMSLIFKRTNFFFTPHAGRVQRHQPDPMQVVRRAVNEALDFFPAQDFRQANGPLRIGVSLRRSSFA